MIKAMLCAAALAFPGAAAAQLDSASVSLDLVLALLGGGRVENTIYQNRLPADLDGAIPLRSADRVVGGIAGSTTGTVVVEVLEDARTALDAYLTHLESEGWERPSLPVDDRGGFQDTRRMGADMWCGDGFLLRPSTLALNGRSYLRLAYTRRDSGRTVCDSARARMPPRRSPFGDLSLPTLEPPPGADVRGGGGGSSSTRIEAEASIESELGLERIFDHYADQLAEAGWVLRGRALGDGAAVARWDVRDDEGGLLVGTMTVWLVAGDDTYQAVLRMDRPEPRR